MAPPDEALQRISPINYLDRITAAVSIHHGSLDDQAPLPWSEDLCRRLQALEKPVECFTYDGQPHTFVGDGDQLFVQRVREFFDGELKKLPDLSATRHSDFSASGKEFVFLVV